MTPQQHLTIASTEHPAAWRYLDEIRAARGADLPGWPEHCFAPISAMATWLRRVDPGHQPGDPGRLLGLGAWRAGQGIYRFDPALSASLRAEPGVGERPAASLLSLPEWSVYVETPDMPQSPGFFALLDHDLGRRADQRSELWLLVDIGERLLPVAMRLPDAGTLTDALTTIGSEPPPPGQDPSTRHRVIVAMRRLIAERLPLLLHLCGPAPAIAGSWPPPRPMAKRTRRLGPRIHPPARPTIWHVGG